MGAAIAFLEQSPDKHAHFSKTNQTMTLIKNMGLVWSFLHKRPLHPLEILGLMGFPAVPQLSLFGESCSFSSSRELHDLPTQRTRRSVCGQAGNSMYVPQAGMALLFYCLHVGPPRQGRLADLASDAFSSPRKRRCIVLD